MPLITSTPFFAPILPLDWCAGSFATEQILIPSVPTSGFGSGVFGNAIQMSQDGNWAIIGGYNAAFGATTGDGSAFVFEKVAGTWTERALLLPTSHATNQRAGESVGISSDGSTVAFGGSGGTFGVGTPGPAGNVYIYERTGGSPLYSFLQVITKVSPPNFFARDILLSDDGLHLLITRRGDNRTDYYDRPSAGNTFTFRQNVIPSVIGLAGTHVSCNDSFDLMIMGTNRPSGGTPNFTIFTRSGAVWTEDENISNPGSSGTSDFADSTGMSNDGIDVVVTEPNRSGNYRIVTYRREGSPLKYVFKQAIVVSAFNFNNDISSMSLSGDGQVVIVGNSTDTSQTGGSGGYYILHKDPTTNVWGNQCDFGELGAGSMGRSVDVSNDGKTIMISDFGGTGGSPQPDDRVFVKTLA